MSRLALAALPAGGELPGAGIGSAGPVDLVAGTVSPKNLPALAGFDLRRAAAPLLGAAAFVHRPDMVDPNTVGTRRLVGTT
ncbi:hypothetical protein [Frigoribacterium sp. PhB24]|uniref:hypothetical protein n=1 Tax=Frigoribacterium sp. PhB24 TaxID=2485204 RepID=UPI000F4A8035|nr:hypothetical protein [Frigoribacterium sp. PhB24]ROS54500.1 hypothetical protein EDF50_0587 [Frigoribacterium sp. PhB24]